MLVLGLSLLLSACKSQAPTVDATPSLDPNAVYTAAAETANAKITEMMANPPATATPEPTATLAVTLTPLVVPTIPLINPAPTQANITPVAPVATVAGPALAEKMEYVADITVPDGSSFPPNSPFVKTWRIKNAGSTTWTTDYQFVYVSGTQMGDAVSVPLPASTAPGATVDISVNLVSPSTEGSHTSYWMLKNPSGKTFGIGPNGDGAIYVQINVAQGANPAAPAATTAPGATPAASSGATVTSVSLSADNNAVGGVGCPYDFLMTATFILSKSGQVSFGFEGQSNTTDFKFNGLPDPVTITWDAGEHVYDFVLTGDDPFKGSLTVVVFEPNQIRSAPLMLELSCK
jgi:hypothetical protein